MAEVQNTFTNDNGMIPIIFSKKVMLEFTKKSKFLDLMTNEQWAGEIKEAGDRVRIIDPNADALRTAKGDVCPTPQGMTPRAKELVIDQKRSFAIAITDTEKKQISIKNIVDGYAAALADKMKRRRVEEVQRDIFENQDVTMVHGTDAAPLDLDPSQVYQLVLQAKMDLLDAGAIDADGTYNFKPVDQETQERRGVFVCGTKLLAMLLQAYQLAFRSGEMVDMVIKDGVVTRVAGLDIHVDRVLDTVVAAGNAGEAPTAAEKEDGVDYTGKAHFANLPFIAGTANAYTQATQLTEVERLRDPYCFQDNIRGLELYGYKLIHPECVVRGVVKKPENIFAKKNGAIPTTVVE